MPSGLILDWDGTIVDTFYGGRCATALKLFCFRHLRYAYSFFEFMEFLFFRVPRPHNGLERLIREARKHDLLLGIVTDRSLFSLKTSAKACGFDLAAFDFIDVRESFLSRFAAKPKGLVVLSHGGSKDMIGALEQTFRWLRSNGIFNENVLFVGDDRRDALAAVQCGFQCILVDRHNPDFALVYWHLKRLEP